LVGILRFSQGFSTYVEQDDGSHTRQIDDQYKVNYFKSHNLLGFHAFVRERCIHVFQLFRRNGLSGCPNILGNFRAYNMIPCMILGSMTFFLGDMHELAIFGRL
jgi:hypothetical protein